MNKNKVNECLDRVITLLVQLKNSFMENGPAPRGVQLVHHEPEPPVEPDPIDESKPDFLSRMDEWPEAVPAHIIVDRNDEIAKVERARGIVEHLIDEDLTGLRFLDFGCGDGHVAYYATEKNAHSVGYDIRESESWGKFEDRGNFTLTTDWKAALDQGPYDVILCFDVLDHVEGIEPTIMMRQLHEALSDNGKIYMRTHPWISRHATHTYHDFNKAFSHLILTDEELSEYIPDYSPQPNIRVQYPLKTYANYFQQANLKVLSTREVKREVEPFFKRDDVASRIIKAAQVGEFPEYQMSLEFIDYVLAKP